MYKVFVNKHSLFLSKIVGSISGNDRLLEVSNAYTTTAFHPSEWWGGYSHS
jgi:hypothetical protein